MVYKDDRDRVLRNIEVDGETGCWNWKKCTSVDGYGRVQWRGDNIGAHRLSWMLFNGKIKDGLCVCHVCDNRKCVNPEHLWLGTQTENIADMDAKGRRREYGRDSSPLAKLDRKTVLEIRKTWSPAKGRADEFSDRYGVSRTQIYRILSGASWPSEEV